MGKRKTARRKPRGFPFIPTIYSSYHRLLANLANALAANQIEAAVKYFEDNVRLKYREKFENKAGRFQNLVTALRSAVLKTAGDGMCIFAYILPGEENGQPVNYYHEIFFMRDELGRWRISSL